MNHSTTEKNKFLQFFDWAVPMHARLLLFCVVAFNFSVYYICRLIAGDWPHIVMNTPLDDSIPMVNWTVVIYFGCYLFWIVNYLMCSHYNKTQAKRFCMADLFGKFVCMIFYIAMPTTIVQPEIVGNDIFASLMHFLYFVDRPDNLFPSIHVFVSWMCFIGMRGDSRYPLWYRVFSCLFAILVFVSTLTTRQHVIADGIAGFVLAEVCYLLTGKLFGKDKSIA